MAASITLFRGLVPELQPYAAWLYDWAFLNGLRPRVTSVRRSRAQQEVLYQRFLRGMSSLPVAPPGRSRHELGLAFDMVTDNPARTGAIWNSMGGKWRSSDWVHFEV